MNTPYWYYNPNVKQAFDVRDILNPVDNNKTNYGIFGGGGALAGAGIGALIEALKSDEEKNYLASMLIGGGLGAGVGLGAKNLGDRFLGRASPDAVNLVKNHKQQGSNSHMFGHVNAKWLEKLLENDPRGLSRLVDQHKPSLDRNNWTSIINALVNLQNGSSF